MTFNDWLSGKAARESRTQLIVGLTSGIGAFFVLLITYFIIFGVSWFITYWFMPLSSTVHFIVAAVVLILLFIGNRTTSRDYLESMSFTTGRG